MRKALVRKGLAWTIVLVFLLMALPVMAAPADSDYDVAIAAADADMAVAKAREKAITAAMQARADARAAYALAEKTCLKVTAPTQVVATTTVSEMAGNALGKALFMVVRPVAMGGMYLSKFVTGLSKGDLKAPAQAVFLTAVSPLNLAVATGGDVATLTDKKSPYGPIGPEAISPPF
jgi:hypothetical protein